MYVQFRLLKVCIWTASFLQRMFRLEFVFKEAMRQRYFLLRERLEALQSGRVQWHRKQK